MGKFAERDRRPGKAARHQRPKIPAVANTRLMEPHGRGLGGTRHWIAAPRQDARGLAWITQECAMAFEKLPPLSGKDIHIGCLCCSTAADVAPLDMPICVGFGAAYVTRDGQMVYDGESDLQNDVEPKTVREIEELAKADPDRDWRIVKHGPMHGETYQRHGDDTWVCVESNEGFA